MHALYKDIAELKLNCINVRVENLSKVLNNQITIKITMYKFRKAIPL